VKGLDNQIFYRFYDCASNIWGNWESLPTGVTCDKPAVAFNGDEMHIIVRGVDGHALWHSHINAITKAFSGWELISGDTQASLSLASSELRSELYLVVRGLDGSTYYKTWNSSGWQEWVALPGSTYDGPGIAVLGNELRIVLRGVDEYTIWSGYVDLTTHSFSNWTLMNGSILSAPALTAQS
jgi:hypothetical protein